MTDDIHGPAFPFRIDPQTGRVAMATGQAKLRQNVSIILGTRHGERPMLREFGTRLHALAHEPNDEVLGELLQDQARRALLQWEPRILVTGARVTQGQEQGEIEIRLQYTHVTEPVTDELIVALR
jgi:uncharacterized protein